MIEILDVYKGYASDGDALPVLQGVSAVFEPGTFTAVCGSSGCGKSTLLLILGGLLHPDHGRITINEDDLFAMSAEQRALRRAQLLGFVFQRFHLVPYLTVEENIRAAAIALKDADDCGRAEELMNRFQIIGRRKHVPGKLSVGELQRTALARALYNRPKVLLADEPTGNLDPLNGEIVLQAFVDFAAAGGTVVMVTHHPDAAKQAGRRWWIRDGKLAEE